MKADMNTKKLKENKLKILVFGSTGATGKEIIKQALKMGYEVSAFARNPEKITLKDKNLSIIKGNILDYNSVEKAFQSHDAVISALGIRSLKKNNTISSGINNIIKAMYKQNIKRFICISAIGVGNSKEQQSSLGFLYNYIVIPFMLKNMFDDKEVQEKMIQESQLDWTIIRPAILTMEERTENYKAFLHNEKNYKAKVSRADLAGFILEILNTKQYINKCISFSAT